MITTRVDDDVGDDDDDDGDGGDSGNQACHGAINGAKPHKFIGFRWALLSQTPVVRKLVRFQ